LSCEKDTKLLKPQLVKKQGKRLKIKEEVCKRAALPPWYKKGYYFTVYREVEFCFIIVKGR
jgi:hypothetical protein